MYDELNRRSQGDKLSLVDRVEALQIVQSLLDRGTTSPHAIAKAIGVDRKTAAKYRDVVIKAQSTEDTMQRENMRMLQLRQINYQIEQISIDLEDQANALRRGEKVNRQNYIAMHNTLRGYFDSRARITGLNWQTTTNLNQMKPLQIITPCMHEKDIS